MTVSTFSRFPDRYSLPNASLRQELLEMLLAMIREAESSIAVSPKCWSRLEKAPRIDRRLHWQSSLKLQIFYGTIVL